MQLPTPANSLSWLLLRCLLAQNLPLQLLSKITGCYFLPLKIPFSKLLVLYLSPKCLSVVPANWIKDVQLAVNHVWVVFSGEFSIIIIETKLLFIIYYVEIESELLYAKSSVVLKTFHVDINMYVSIWVFSMNFYASSNHRQVLTWKRSVMFHRQKGLKYLGTL